jgi:NitT/TauT family transport system ATP-binding protein
MDPKLLLMDEPFGALDALTRELMQEELVRVAQEASLTVVFVTHDISEAVYLGDRVVVMSRRPGRIVAVEHIDLPRPRSSEVKGSPEMADYHARYWEMLREEQSDAAAGR